MNTKPTLGRKRSYQLPDAPPVRNGLNLAENIRYQMGKLLDGGLTQQDLAERTGVNQSAISSFLTGKRGETGIGHVEKYLQAVGARVVWPGDTRDSTRGVRLVEAQRNLAHARPPDPSGTGYRAIPLVSQAWAGPDPIPEEHLKDWLLVRSNHASVQRCEDLLAVEIAQHQYSMTPTLHPFDVVLVCRDPAKREVQADGRGIYLVREPGQGGGAMVRRVRLQPSGKGETTVIFYSDNVEQYPPDTYSLKADFDGDLDRAIIGRCVWAWGDLMKK